MLSYRHAFHAGNHADVLKHLVLCECLRLLSRKEKGFLAVDTHAGAGEYALTEGYAAQNAEWRTGIEALRSRGGEKAPDAVTRYLDQAEKHAGTHGGTYPGSPAIIANQLREQDRAVFCELHPTDHVALERLFRPDRRIRVRKADGFAELKALLPPPTRRALVFIDPSYELASDYELVVDALRDSFRRFAGGVYAVWYPLLDRSEALELPQRLAALGAYPTLNASLLVERPVPGRRGLYGSGMFIFNPPWTLEETLREVLPYLGAALGNESAWDLQSEDAARDENNATDRNSPASNRT